ncbi:uncharacterized protein LOC144886906 isoform X2 [Branchiostoma floridae x Branchiostoma japonicum]
MQRSRVTCRAAAVSVLGLLWVVTAVFACPETCDCVPGGEVDCSRRGLTVVPANIPLGTTGLSLYYNNIQNLSDADFSHLTSLERLHLSNNDIRVLPAGVFSHLTRLKWLDLDNNDIRVLPAGVFSHLTSLEWLALYNNDIRVLPAGVFSHLTSLVWLRLSGNHIADLPDGVFSNLTSLEGLILNNNNISSVPTGVFSHLTSLQGLDLTGNHIADLPDGVFSHLTSLQELKLSGNHIADLPDGVFSHLTSLVRLYLYNNNISSVPTGVFSHLTSLQELYIAENPWRCDCNLYGLLTLARQGALFIAVNPTCSSPPHMKGVALSSVTGDKVCLGRGDCTTGSVDGTCACNVRWTGPFCGTDDNLALGKKASQSSNRAFNGVSAGAEKGVDGSVTDCAVTNPEQQSWWQVDLAGYYRVSRVRVINRFDVDTATPTSAPGCGGILTAPPGGTVTSPNYPGHYGNFATCEWTITVPEGSRVLLTFDSFQLEDGFDYLTIYDGGSSSAPRLQRLTGNAILDPITSTSNQLFVRFTSDTSNTAQGFQFSYTATGTLMVRVGPNEDFTQNGQCGQTYAVGSALEFETELEADCDPSMYGRYVSVQAMPPLGVNTTGLVLCEVEVYVTDICCNHAIRVMNGQITATDGYCSGNDIQFSCDLGYELAGRPSATCQNNGSWDGEIPTCQQPTEESPSSIQAIIGGTTNTEPTEESPTSTQAIIGGTSAGIAAALIVAAVCFVVFLRRRRKKRREEDPQTIEVDFLSDHVGIRRRRMEEMVPLVPPRTQFPKLEVDPSRVTLGQRIGSGAFGLVYRATLTRDDRTEDVVVKTVKENASEDDKLGFLEEIRAVVDLGAHDNLLGLINCCTVVRDHLYLITEFMPYGDLKSFLRKCREEENSDGYLEPRDDIYNFEVMQMYQVARQIARGMDHIAQSRYVHGDLAARNVLVGERLKVKISDFGLAEDIYSRGYRRQDQDQKRPWKWMAPERLDGGEVYDTQSDVWSFGIVLYEICTLGGDPYPGVAGKDLKEQLQAGYRMRQPEDCPDTMYDLMLHCWQWKPTERPSFQLLEYNIDKNLAFYAPEYATTV